MEYIDGTCVYVIMRKNPALDDNLPTKCLNVPNQLNIFLTFVHHVYDHVTMFTAL